MKFCFDILDCLKNTIVGLFVTHRERSNDASFVSFDEIDDLLLLDSDGNKVQYRPSIELQDHDKSNEFRTHVDMGCTRRPPHGGSHSPDRTSPILIRSSPRMNPMINDSQGNASQPYSPPRTPPRIPLSDITEGEGKQLTEENLANHSNELSSSSPGMLFGKINLNLVSPGSTCSSFSAQSYSSDFSGF